MTGHKSVSAYCIYAAVGCEVRIEISLHILSVGGTVYFGPVADCNGDSSGRNGKAILGIPNDIVAVGGSYGSRISARIDSLSVGEVAGIFKRNAIERKRRARYNIVRIDGRRIGSLACGSVILKRGLIGPCDRYLFSINDISGLIGAGCKCDGHIAAPIVVIIKADCIAALVTEVAAERLAAVNHLKGDHLLELILDCRKVGNR